LSGYQNLSVGGTCRECYSWVLSFVSLLLISDWTQAVKFYVVIQVPRATSFSAGFFYHYRGCYLCQQ